MDQVVALDKIEPDVFELYRYRRFRNWRGVAGLVDRLGRRGFLGRVVGPARVLAIEPVVDALVEDRLVSEPRDASGIEEIVVADLFQGLVEVTHVELKV